MLGFVSQVVRMAVYAFPVIVTTYDLVGSITYVHGASMQVCNHS